MFDNDDFIQSSMTDVEEDDSRIMDGEKTGYDDNENI